ncbi:hypothetical protein F5148DRAFT_1316353 [Russula earlei]|uniref:Uncharacterized protein n=1 Tax=Russula earlei TaxID=71964 RepID=A0ACC0UJ00_9AGAM|nr:hypothetical protein F5148DRAFT_1316353 [Russula earlei]
MVGQSSDSEATVVALVGVARHPYHDLDLRLGVWHFMALTIETEPALGHPFIMGHFRAPKEESTEDKGKSKRVSALDAAREMLANWNEYWETNPQLLSAVLGFLTVVWQCGWDHQSTLINIRKNSEFWSQLAALAKEEISPAPEYKSKELVEMAGYPRAAYHESISSHSYRPGNIEQSPNESIFESEEQFSNELHEAIFNAYDPTLYADFAEKAEGHLPDLVFEHYESRELVRERELGNDFAFASKLLQLRMELSNIESMDTTVAHADELIHMLFSINLNLSLVYASTQLGQSWQAFLVKVAPFLQGDIKFRPVVMSLASSISASIVKEKRSGEIILTAHGVHLAILLALPELVLGHPKSTTDYITAPRQMANTNVADLQAKLKQVEIRITKMRNRQMEAAQAGHNEEAKQYNITLTQ